MRWVLGSGLRFWRLVVALAIGVAVFGIAHCAPRPSTYIPSTAKAWNSSANTKTLSMLSAFSTR